MRGNGAGPPSCASTTPTSRAAGPSTNTRAKYTDATRGRVRPPPRGNLSTLGEARLWAPVVTGPIQPLIEDAAFLAEAAAKLPLIGRSRSTQRLPGRKA